jgi:nicotinamide-nucleotide amidase
MNAEIITVGDELLIGQVVDTNSAWIGRELNKIGVEVMRIVSVRDLADEITGAVDTAMKRADVVLMTGGLGPTKDDITKQTLCRYFGTRLVFSEEVYRNVERLLKGRVAMNKLNRDQALVPEACTVINNRVGTASVSWFERDGKVLVSMPGVPQEMKTIMTEEIIPRLRKMFVSDLILHHTFLVRNYAESILAEYLSDWEDQLPENIKLAYLPKMGIIRLRLTARGRQGEGLEQRLDAECDKLRELLGSNIMGEGDAAAEGVLGDLLRSRGLTVATAESCTGGSVAARITSVPGSSDYFKGSVVAYANEVKLELLGVKEETLRAHGAVSEETVREMVAGVRRLMRTDCAIATSGIAGPGGGTADKPVGTIWIAAAVGDKICAMKQFSDRGREMNVERAGNNALLQLIGLIES